MAAAIPTTLLNAGTSGSNEPSPLSRKRAWRRARGRRGLTWAQRKARSTTYTLGKVA